MPAKWHGAGSTWHRWTSALMTGPDRNLIWSGIIAADCKPRSCSFPLRALPVEQALESRHLNTHGTAPTIGVDVTQQFKPGQTVQLRRSWTNRSAAEGDYKIVQRLPDTDAGSELQYRIKSVREAHERVVKESDLRKV